MIVSEQCCIKHYVKCKCDYTNKLGYWGVTGLQCPLVTVPVIWEYDDYVVTTKKGTMRRNLSFGKTFDVMQTKRCDVRRHGSGIWNARGE